MKDDSGNDLETYGYGAGREKLTVQNSLSTNYYVWGGSSIIAEYSMTLSAMDYTKSYFYAGSRLLMKVIRAGKAAEAHEYHHPDRLGTQYVTSGSSGDYRQTTLPFGTAISAETTGNSNQVFTSYDRSSVTGLDYATNRTYSQGQSRFTQVDPIGMASASIGNPQSNNLYAYVQNMPTDFVDPTGLMRMVERCRDTLQFYYVDGYLDSIGIGRTCDYVFVDDGGGTVSGGTTSIGMPPQDGPCARMAARAQRVWGEVLRATNKTLSGNTSLNVAALPAFDLNFNSLYTGKAVDGSRSSVLFYAGQNQVNSAPREERGQFDFKEKFHDSDPNQTEQTHHLAFHFSAGLNSAVLSSYSQLADELFGPSNPGDVALTEAAYAFGQKIRKNPNLMANIGRNFSDEFCR